MEQIINGTIRSTELGNIGKVKYGFLGVETESHEIIEVKVTAFTVYDTLKIGEMVRIICEPLDRNGLWVAKSIHKII